MSSITNVMDMKTGSSSRQTQCNGGYLYSDASRYQVSGKESNSARDHDVTCRRNLYISPPEMKRSMQTQAIETK